MNKEIELQIFKEFQAEYQKNKDLSYDKFLSEVKKLSASEIEEILLWHEARKPSLTSKSPRRNRRIVRRYIEACKQLNMMPDLSQEIIDDAYIFRTN